MLFITIFILLLLLINKPNAYLCDSTLDPGHMFSLNDISTSDDNQMMFRGNSCKLGADIVLKRLVRKLFNHVNQLQPDELDDEYIYQSSLNFNDYIAMMKFLNQNAEDNDINCANLNNLEVLLSNFITSARVSRPSQLNDIFSSLPYLNPFGHWMYMSDYFGTMNLLIILSTVGVVSWILRGALRLSMWKSVATSMLIVGFVQFYMNKKYSILNRANSQRCLNPSLIARFAAYFNYDYDNCRVDLDEHEITNIALIGVEYLSHIVFQPMVDFGAKSGKALESFLNSFTGMNYVLAPFFPLFVIVSIVFIGMPIAVLMFQRRSQRRPYQQRTISPSKMQSLKGPRRNGKFNTIKSH